MDMEAAEMKAALHGITEAVQRLAIDHATVRGTIDSVQQNINHLKETLVDARRETTASIAATTASIGTLSTKVEGVVSVIPDLQRRVGLLEKVVLGACAIILVAVVTAWVKGAVIIPGITTGGAQVTMEKPK